MARQRFQLLTEGSIRIEFHVTEDAGGLTLTSLFNPPRDPDMAQFTSIDEMADAMEVRVNMHLGEHGARLRRIRYLHDDTPVTLQHLSRYAVPVIAQDDGRRE